MGEKIVDVLLYFGDPGESLGELQGMNLEAGTVKVAMGCTNVIDLRRRQDTTPWGRTFVYDPAVQTVYTTPSPPGPVLHILGSGKETMHDTVKSKPFPIADKKHVPLVEGMAEKGYHIFL